MQVTVEANSKLSGQVTPPASKSMSHRVLLAAALSDQKSTFTGMVFSKDVSTTLEAIKALGGDYKVDGDRVTITPIATTPKEKTLHCLESATTLRMLIPIAAALGVSAAFTGEESLKERPLHSIVKCIGSKSLEIAYNGSLPLTINGKLKGGDYFIEGDVTSQFISGLLFALPLLETDSTLTFTTPLTSVGYIDMTLQVLQQFGIAIKQVANGFQIKGNQQYKAIDLPVEKDYSAAAFYACAGALGADIAINGMNKNSKQGDRKVFSILEKMGAVVLWGENTVQVKKGELNGIVIDGSQIPDIVPVLSVVAAVSEGKTVIQNVGRLRVKECDRLKATALGLNTLGAKVTEGEDFLEIEGVESLGGGEVQTFGDHRIAMSFAIASLVSTKPVIIDNKACVKKSYPGFWEDFVSLGGEIK